LEGFSKTSFPEERSHVGLWLRKKAEAQPGCTEIKKGLVIASLPIDQSIKHRPRFSIKIVIPSPWTYTPQQPDCLFLT
jgi:hypothetical protein